MPGRRSEGRRDSAPASEAALRHRIREVTYQLLGEHGYHGTTTRMIANALGVSVPALYYHYGSKQELFAGVMRTDILEALELLRAAVEPFDSPTEALEAAVRANVRRRFRIAEFRMIQLRELRFVESPYREEIIRYRDEFEQIFIDLVRRCVEAGLIRLDDSPALLSRAALQMMNGIADWYRPEGPLTEAEIEDLYVRLVWNLLALECAPPGVSPPSQEPAETPGLPPLVS